MRKYVPLAPDQPGKLNPASETVCGPARSPHILGAQIVPGGVDFAVVATHAKAVDLCLFTRDRDGVEVESRLAMLGPVGGIWHGHVSGLGAGTTYAYRVHGDFDPSGASRHNPYKLLLDPYGRAIDTKPNLSPSLYAHLVDDSLHPVEPISASTIDSAPDMAKSVVTAQTFPVVPGPNIPWNKTIIYEAHVKGLTQNLPGVPQEIRGTYAGLAHRATTDYLRNLGITTVELLPIHAKFDEPFLTAKGLSNYWGYSTLSYFAPEPTYASEAARARGPQGVLDEVRGMVSMLHEAGLEVILDVVYNHSCEGAVAGPSLSLRGLDAQLYYLHDGGNPALMRDVTGCGNSLNFASPRVVQLALDSLRYWAQVVGVDGFRFDLATTLGRFGDHFTPDHPFFVAVTADPVLGGKKMIAEPWDMGPNGWQTGNFPYPFADWNDRFRSTVRQFWIGDAKELSKGGPTTPPADLATRLAGSADLFSTGLIPGGRGPGASVNFVTAHDGFTMADLVCYDHKHNEANLEGNRDGTDDNRSWNHGIDEERSTCDTRLGITSELLPVRMRSMLNLFGTLLVSAGVPMLVAGDEVGRTQFGNNNAYCQDNEISWIDWDLSQWQKDLRTLVAYLIELRQKHPVLRPDRFASGIIPDGEEIADLSWFDAQAVLMTDYGWHDRSRRVFQMLRSGAIWGDCDALIVVNGLLEPTLVQLPPARKGPYRLVFNSSWSVLEDCGFSAHQLARHSDPVFPGSTEQLESLSMRIYLSHCDFDRN